MPGLPSGTVTFMFTDIEGSTQMFGRLGDAYAAVLEQHRVLLRAAVAAHKGVEVATEGDGFFIAFTAVRDGIGAAVDIQRAIAAHPWSDGEAVHVRIGLHTGHAEPVGDDYVSFAVHEAARVAGTAHGGQIVVSQATAALADALPAGATLRDLGEHRLKDLLQPQRLYQVDHPELPNEHPPLRSLRANRTNLPVQLTSFVGREAEVAEVAKLLRHDRLVTVTGSGGVGKTRLALQVAAAVMDDFPGGCWFVDLAPVRELDGIGAAALRALGVPQTQDDPVAALATRAGDEPTLLVVDNCEHVVDAAAVFVERALVASPALRVLATSREPIGVPGEIAWRAPSLEAPAVDSSGIEVIARSPAAQLLLDRIAVARPGYVLTEADVPPLVEICNRLDGIPLAIELAAARMRSMTPSQVALRLDDRFRLLAGGSRALPRHQTLDATIAWSVDLLSVEERELFATCAAFAGSFDLAAVVAVGSVDPIEAADTLSRLVDRSLVVADLEPAEPRYRLLETTRAFAVDRLLDPEKRSELRASHATYFEELLTASYARRWGPDERVVFHEVIASDADMVEAIRFAHETADTARVARLNVMRHDFLSRDGRDLESATALATALDAAAGRERAAVLVALADAWSELGHVDRTDEFAREALALLESEESASVERTWAIRLRALWAFGHSDVALGLQLDHDSLTSARAVGMPWLLQLALGWLADDLLRVGDTVNARALLAEADLVGRDVGSAIIDQQIADVVVACELEAGDPGAAIAVARAQVARARDSGSPSRHCGAWINLGRVATHAHDDALAFEALAVAEELQARGDVVGSLIPLFRLAAIAHRNAGNTTEARAAAQEWARLARREGRLGEEKQAEGFLAWLDVVEGAPDGEAKGRRLLAEAEVLTFPSLELAMRQLLALAGIERGDPGELLLSAEQMLTLSQWSGSGSFERAGAAETLELVARAALKTGRYAVAARCLGAAEAHWPFANGIRSGMLAKITDTTRREVAAALGEKAYGEEFDAGAALSPDAAMADALNQLS